MSATMWAVWTVLPLLLSAACGQVPQLLGQFALDRPAFVEIFTSVDQQQTLYISNFNPVALLQPDYVYRLKNPGSQLSDVSSWQMETIDHLNYWPNDVIYTPSSVLGREAIVWTSGFLVPTKTDGALNIYFTDTDPLDGPHNIASLDPAEYSYHRVVWLDVNGDGLQDAVTQRFHQPLLGGTTKEFVWLENPGGGVVTGWPEHVVLTGGADIHFQVVELQASGQTFQVVINAEFFNQRVTIYYADDNANFWTDPSLLKTVIIDDTIGQPFDIYFEDLNLDGKKEILVTAYDGSEGRVYVYGVPDDFRNEPFQRVIIAEGFIPNTIIGGESMSPGSAHLFYTSTEHQSSGNKPYILLSGDDDGQHYILTPHTEDPNDWGYTKNVLIDTRDTTSGKAAVADLDGDGYNEIVAAGYSIGQIYVFSYRP